MPQVEVAVQERGHARLPVEELASAREVDHEPPVPVRVVAVKWWDGEGSEESPEGAMTKHPHLNSRTGSRTWRLTRPLMP